MPRTTSLLLLLLLPGCGAASPAPASPGPPRAKVPPELRVAITVDDLPSAGDDYPGVTRVDLVKQVVRTLVAHHVPRAVGFVVGAQLAARPERGAAIDAWVAAGFEVGSHSSLTTRSSPAASSTKSRISCAIGPWSTRSSCERSPSTDAGLRLAVSRVAYTLPA